LFEFTQCHIPDEPDDDMMMMMMMTMMSSVRTPNVAWCLTLMVVIKQHFISNFTFYSGLKCSLCIEYVLLATVSTTEVGQL
jgi:hypothetical protein